MDRSKAAANWQERLVALTLVMAVGLATQFLVERTLPAPSVSRAALFAPSLGFEQAALEAPSRTVSLSAAGAGDALDDEAARARAFSTLAPEEVSTGSENRDDELRRAPGVRTRTRRFLPAPNADVALEVRAPQAPRVALGALPAGWIDVSAPLRSPAEAASETAVLLVPEAHGLVAVVPSAMPALVFTLAIADELEAEVSKDGSVLVLRDRDGVIVEERPVPPARDARRRRVPARYEDDDGVPRLRLDPRGAVPPIDVRTGGEELPRNEAAAPRAEDAPPAELLAPLSVPSERAPPESAPAPRAK